MSALWRCRVLHRPFWMNYDSFVARYRKCRWCGRVYEREGWRWAFMYQLRGWFR